MVTNQLCLLETKTDQWKPIKCVLFEYVLRLLSRRLPQCGANTLFLNFPQLELKLKKN